MKKIILASLLVMFPLFCFAETIVLKSGKTVEGRIVEKNKDSVKIEVCEIPVTYFLDEIKSINGQSSASSSSAVPQIASQTSLKTAQGPECVRSSNIVTIKNKQLWIRKRLTDGSLDQPMLFVIKGISWSPATIAPDTGPNPDNPFNPMDKVPYGFFFDWEGRKPQGHEVFLYWLRSQFFDHYKKDIPLIKAMNVNTVRVYTDFSLNPGAYNKILDEFYKNNIMVIVTVSASKSEMDSGRYAKVVQEYKDHPAVLMWALGNEWNLDYNKFWGYTTVAEAAEAVNKAAAEIKKIDSNHPVCSVIGDRFTDLDPTNTIEWVLRICPEVDVWGINVYRGVSFGDLFKEWEKISSKPLFIAEFGTDSFRTISYDVTADNKAYNCKGEEDEEMQAKIISSLYKELKNHLSALDEKEICLGGLVYGFNDELWKAGSYHVGLGGLVDYKDPEQKTSYKRYDTQGYCIKGSHPDDVANEEYFGVVNANRVPKKAYHEIQRLYGE